MSRIISIGKQDFVSLRKNHYFYIDKTDFIRQWWESEKYRIRQGTYRVIFVSFADVKQNNYKGAVQKIKNIIVDVYRQNRYLNEQECFTENEHRQI
ncbi:P-loop NTPase family protein [Roseburia rectibacter]|jgi:hypothetical protein|uniref:hypothetical protein n=1 Tax=Roseburia rectibacter TaxID=2763062 RepID=UPI002ED4A3AB